MQLSHKGDTADTFVGAPRLTVTASYQYALNLALMARRLLAKEWRKRLRLAKSR